jgi:hypothetical protein
MDIYDLNNKHFYRFYDKRKVFQFDEDEVRNNNIDKMLTLQLVEIMKTYNLDENWRDNKESMYILLKFDGNFLKFASENLKNDEDIVLMAVKQNGVSIQYAPDKFKENKDIALVAISKNVKSHWYISKEIQYDWDICFLLLEKCPNAIKNFPPYMVDDLVFMEELEKRIK